MREERLFIRPFEDLRILNYRAVQQINQHADVQIKGIIPFDRKDDYMDAGRKQLWIQVFGIEDGKEEILFYGVVTHMQIEVQNGICNISLSIASGTILMDMEKHIRSFQNDEYTFSDLLDICSQSYGDASKIMTQGKKKIPHFIMQYRETDWEFFKRLASLNNTVLFADCSTKGEKYHFGIPNRNMDDENIDEYRIEYDMQDYWNKKNSSLDIQPDDTKSYIWDSREIHKLGEKRIIDGKELFIWKIESYQKGNELYHTCFMKARSGFFTPVQYNSCISGVSLTGTVADVYGEKVQVKIMEDENNVKNKFCEFSFSTMYSSPDGTGWYSMPEPGDIVRLYFPTNREQEAYAASAYHEEDTELRDRPEHKFWRNKEGKEIRLSPERILLTNNDGTYIEISDENGIFIVSKGGISIQAEGTLSISAKSSIELSAPNDVTLIQGDTVMELGGDITMQGAKIML